MKYYLVLTIHQQTNEYIKDEYLQSCARYDSLEECITQWHTALSSYRNKATTIRVSASIIDEKHEWFKREVFERKQEVATPSLTKEDVVALTESMSKDEISAIISELLAKNA